MTKLIKACGAWLGASMLTSLAYAPAAEACLSACNLPRIDGKAKNVQGKTINGLECQVDLEDKDKDWGYTNIGQICNQGDEDLLVHCPLMRTQLPSKDGLSCASATLVYQQNGGDEPGCGLGSERAWNCVLLSRDETGWLGWWVGSGPWPDDDGDYGTPNAHIPELHYAPANVWETTWQAAINDSFPVDTGASQGGTYMMSCLLPSTGTCGGETCLSSLKWWER